MERFGPFLIGLTLALSIALLARYALSPTADAVPGNGILYGTDAGAGVLLNVSTVTGAGTVIGSLGFNAPALAVDPISGKMYAGTGSLADDLYEVNPANAATTLKGGSGLGTYAFYGGMDFDAAGVLYASMNLAGDGNTGSDYLVTVNTSNGAATVVGPFGTCTGNSIPHNANDGSCTLEGVEAIAFDNAGNLWAAENVRGAFGTPGLYTVNKITGAATFVAAITDGSGHPSGGVVTIQFACDGTLYGGSARRTGGNTDGGRLGTINTGTGAWTFTGVVPATSGNPSNSLGGLAFQNQPCPTPTPTATPSPTPTATPSPTPTPTPGPSPTPSPTGGGPNPVGGIVGLIDEPVGRSASSPQGESGDRLLHLAMIFAGGLAISGGAWFGAKRLKPGA